MRQHIDGRSQQDGEHQDRPKIDQIAFGHDGNATRFQISNNQGSMWNAGTTSGAAETREQVIDSGGFAFRAEGRALWK